MPLTPLDLITLEERSDLASQLMAEWWIIAVETLVDSVGSERTLELLRPHFVHGGRASSHVIRDRLGWRDTDLKTMSTQLSFMHYLLRRNRGQILMRGDEEAMITFDECALEGQPVEGCVSLCYFTTLGTVEETNPRYEGDLPRLRKNGDPFCAKRVRLKGAPNIPESDPRWKSVEVEYPEMSLEERNYFSCAYLGESWLMGTRALIEAIGAKEAVTRSSQGMRTRGMTYGATWKIKLGLDDDASGAATLIDFFNTVLGQNGLPLRHDDSRPGKVIGECPFSGAMPEACAQVEAFFDGVCHEFQPELRFRYTRMLSKGQDSCGWVIERA